MTTVASLMTAEEFQLTTDPPGQRTELVRGVIVASPLWTALKGHLAVEIGVPISEFVETHDLGHVTGSAGYCLFRSPDTVRAPSCAWIAFDRVPPGGIPEDAYLDAAPNLAVEVVSMNDRELDIDEKVADWLSAGCERAWVVRPRQRTVTVHRPNGDSHRYTAADTLTSDDAAFPVAGFELKVAAIFE